MQISKIEATAMASSVVDRVAFHAAIKAVSATVDSRNTIPVLDNIRISANGDMLRLVGTDLDIEVTADIAGQAIDSRTDFNAPAKMLDKLLNSAPKANYVAIDCISPEKTQFEFEKASYKLPSIELDADTRRDLALRPATGRLFTIDGETLRKALDRVQGAISTEETRYYLNGIYFHDRGGDIALVSTDGHRLYRQVLDKPESFSDIMQPKTEDKDAFRVDGVIIPRKAILVLLKLLGKKAPAEVDIRMDATRVEFTFPFEFGSILVRTKTIDGTFPDYVRVIPTQNDKHAVMAQADVLEALKATTFIFTTKNRAIKINLGETNSITAKDDGGATAEFPIEPECNFSDPLEVGLNSDYLKDVVTNLGKTVDFAFNDAGSPVVMTSPDMVGFTAVQMPMRVRP